GGIEQMPHDGLREVTIRLLDQQHVTPVRRVAKIGERVLVASRLSGVAALDLPGIGVGGSRLADQVEREIAEREILLEHRRVADPFRYAMTEDQRVIGEPQRVDE